MNGMILSKDYYGRNVRIDESDDMISLWLEDNNVELTAIEFNREQLKQFAINLMKYLLKVKE
jgi:hypothetical protein